MLGGRSPHWEEASSQGVVTVASWMLLLLQKAEAARSGTRLIARKASLGLHLSLQKRLPATQLCPSLWGAEPLPTLFTTSKRCQGALSTAWTLAPSFFLVCGHSTKRGDEKYPFPFVFVCFGIGAQVTLKLTTPVFLMPPSAGRIMGGIIGS